MTKTFNMKQKAFFIIFRGLFIKYSQTTSNSKITKLKDENFPNIEHQKFKLLQETHHYDNVHYVNYSKG